jgi:ribosome-associated protein
MTDSETIARACAGAAAEKKAENLVLLDLRGVSGFTDFFLICSGTSEPQLKAISSSIRESLREKFGRRPLAEDGYPASQWVVLDYGDVICHLFHGEKREFYDLENLWSDAKRIALEGLEVADKSGS